MCPWRDPEGVLFSRAAPTAGAGRRVSLEFLLLYMELPSVATGKRRQQPHICPKPMAARPNAATRRGKSTAAKPDAQYFLPNGPGLPVGIRRIFYNKPEPANDNSTPSRFRPDGIAAGGSPGVPGTGVLQNRLACLHLGQPRRAWHGTSPQASKRGTTTRRRDQPQTR